MPNLTPAREALIAGLGVLVLHGLMRLSVAPGAFQDDAIYLALGKALAQGEGWRSIYAAGAPVHLKYPPGLPGLYALMWLAGGSLARTLTLVGGFHLLIAGVCGGLVWWIARVRLGLSALAATVATLALALVSVVDHWQLAIAEGPFVAAWLGALALAQAPLSTRRAVGLGLLLAATALLRTQGVAVVIGLFAAFVVTGRDRRLTLLAATVTLAPLLAWWGVHASLAAHGPGSTQPDEAGYLASLTDLSVGRLLPALLEGFRLNVAAYWRIIPREFGPAGPGHLLVLIGMALVVLGAILGGRRLLPLGLSLGISLMLVLLWPFTQARFILALVPVAGLLIAYGWSVLAGRLPPRGALLLAVSLVGVIAVRQAELRRGAAVGFQPVGRTLAANTAWLEAVAPWVEAHTPRDARILTEGAAGLWLATGRVGVAALPATPNYAVSRSDGTTDVASRLLDDGVTVVIASSPPVYAGVVAMERRCPGTFRRGNPIGEIAAAFGVNDSTRACLATADR